MNTPKPDEFINRILDALPAPLRVTFVMFEIEGRSCLEIADLMAIPLGTVHSRLHKARKRFRAALRRQRQRGVASERSLGL